MLAMLCKKSSCEKSNLRTMKCNKAQNKSLQMSKVHHKDNFSSYDCHHENGA